MNEKKPRPAKKPRPVCMICGTATHHFWWNLDFSHWQ